MKNPFKTVLLTSLSLLIVGQAAVNAQAPAAPAPAPAPAPAAPADRANGAVTALDTTANTLTVHDRRSDSDVTFVLNSDTKYTKSVNVDITTLAVGNFITASSREDLAAGATSVDAWRITLLTELPTGDENRPNTRGVTGTILTTTPSLTIKALDGTTVTINTTPETTVSSTVPATIADVAVGDRVNVRGKLDGTTVTAKEVQVLPARRPRPTQ